MGSVLLLSRDTPRSHTYPGPHSSSAKVFTSVPARLRTKRKGTAMEPRYYARPLSPGGRRIQHAERASTGAFGAYDDPYYPHHSCEHYNSPRSSGERIVAAGSVQSAYASPSSSTSRLSSGTYDAYSGRPRRSTLTDHSRPLSAHHARPTVIHSGKEHPASPLALSWETRETHVTPAITVPPPRREHKKIYSVDEGTTRLIAEREEPRGSRDRSSRKSYHASGPSARHQELNDEYYSYTDAASMFRDTEPRWRHSRGSSDSKRDRPSSMIYDGYGATPRSSRELGPPPSTRGFDKIHGAGVARAGSTRERGRSSSRDRYKDHTHPVYRDPRDSDSIVTVDRSIPVRAPSSVHQDRDGRREERRVPRDGRYSPRDDYDDRYERSYKGHSFEDSRIAERGFGIRAAPSSYDGRGPAYPLADPIVSQPNVLDYIPVLTEEERREQDRRDREYVIERERQMELERRERERERERLRERDEYRRDRDRDERDHIPSTVAPAIADGAAYAVHDALEKTVERRQEDGSDRNRRSHITDSSDLDPRERHYVEQEESKREKREKSAETVDPDEEYRRRVQAELERSGKSRDSDSDKEREQRRRERHERRERDAEENKLDRNDARNSILEGPLVKEPADVVSDAASDQSKDTRDSRVRIVEPPKSEKLSPPPPKGILRKPTEKFPEDPNPIREGVAPLKDAKKGKDIPLDARWTKIDRRLVNPEALEEAKERFEERMDCVIVLRVLTRDEIQRLADRTKEIREEREEERYREERRHRRHRDRVEEEDPERLAIEAPSVTSSSSGRDRRDRDRD